MDKELIDNLNRSQPWAPGLRFDLMIADCRTNSFAYLTTENIFITKDQNLPLRIWTFGEGYML